MIYLFSSLVLLLIPASLSSFMYLANLEVGKTLFTHSLQLGAHYDQCHQGPSRRLAATFKLSLSVPKPSFRFLLKLSPFLPLLIIKPY